MKHLLAFFITLMLALPSSVSAQSNSVTIIGNIKQMKPGEWLHCKSFYGTGEDSVRTIAGGFRFMLTIPAGDGDMYYLQIGNEYTDNKYVHLFLDKGVVTISGTGSDFSRVQLSGTTPIADLNSYNRIPQIAEMETVYQRIKSLRGSADSAAQAPALRQQYDSLDSVKTIMSKQWVAKHPASSISPYILLTLWYYVPLPELDTMMATLSEQAKKNAPAKEFVHSMTLKKRLDIGKPALDFTQPDTLGQAVSLKDFRGKYVLIDFWASWCHPCRLENPNVRKAYEEFKNKDFTVLGVSLDDDKASWLAAIHKDGLAWTHVSDLISGRNAAAEAYGIRGIPMNFLIDPAGIVIAKDLHGEELLTKLAAVLNH